VKLRDEAFLSQLASLKADLQIVVAFRMLPEAVWNMPRLGTFNLHASLLPQYRGAAPINWAVINGETMTGVTTFFLTHEIDAGRIILNESLPVSDDDDAGSVHDALMKIGASLVVRTVDLIASGRAGALASEQPAGDGCLLHPAPKIFNETCRIDWNLPLKNVYDFIRGLSPYPAAWTTLTLPGAQGGQTLKIYRSEKRFATHSLRPGTVLSDSKTCLDVAVSGGYLRLTSLQLAGKKRMDAASFLNGFKYVEGSAVE
jgi:methionyl-tRNA formyltransferase